MYFPARLVNRVRKTEATRFCQFPKPAEERRLFIFGF